MSPAVIVLLVVVGLVVVVYLFGLSPEPSRGRRSTPGIIKRRSRWRRWLPVVPLLAAVGCLVLAFTGFRLDVRETSPTIVLVMDVSNSMNATDIAPSRLAAAEAAALAFLDELPADFRVGLATFAGRAELEVAPTEERQDVVDALGTLETSLGTVIGDGLTTALDAIQEVRASGAAPAAALLLSDGRDTGSAVSPADAAERARTLEVPVFTVVTGQVEGGEGGLANLEVLEEISTVSDGDTFTAETADELTRVYENLGSALSVDLDVEGFSTPLVVAAIGLAIVAGFMLVLIPR